MKLSERLVEISERGGDVKEHWFSSKEAANIISQAWNLEIENSTLHEKIDELNRKLEARDDELFKWEGLGNYVQGPDTKIISHEENRVAILQRITELEEQNDELIERYASIVRWSQSQLVWTSISEGLPKEPGLYEILWNGNEITGPFTLADIVNTVPSMQKFWTHYRSVELPK